MRPKAGHSSGTSGNKVYYNLRGKKDNERKAFFDVVEASDSGGYEVVETTTSVKGVFIGLEHSTYETKVNNKPMTKDKIIVYLYNDETHKIMVVSAPMGNMARTLMNNMTNLWTSHKNDIDFLEISVWTSSKNESINNNLALRHWNPSIDHDGEKIGWYFDWEKQSSMITEGQDGFNDYKKLNQFLINMWKKIAVAIDSDPEVSRYKAMFEQYLEESEEKSSYKDMPDGEIHSKNFEQSKTHTPIGSDDEDDLPF